ALLEIALAWWLRRVVWSRSLPRFDLTRLDGAVRRLLSPSRRPPRGIFALAAGGRLPAIVLAFVLAPAALAATLPASAGATRVIALDVGQGDAYLFEAGGATLLIDGGPDPVRVIDELGATLGPW